MKLNQNTYPVGNTPTAFVETYLGVDIYIKFEGSNPSGSLKDRLVTWSFDNLVPLTDIEGRILIDATSGSLGCALALWGATHRHPVLIATNEKISRENLALLRAYDAEVVFRGVVTRESRDYCVELINDDEDNYFFFDQLGRDGMSGAYCSIAAEILRDTPDVNHIVASKGSGVTLEGICAHLATQEKQVFAYGSIGIPGDKGIVGTYKPGMDFETNAIRRLVTNPMYRGDVPVSFEQVMHTWRKLIKQGVSVGPQGAGVYLAIKRLIDEEILKGTVVGVAGDTSHKHLSRLEL